MRYSLTPENKGQLREQMLPETAQDLNNPAHQIEIQMSYDIRVISKNPEISVWWPLSGIFHDSHDSNPKTPA